MKTLIRIAIPALMTLSSLALAQEENQGPPPALVEVDDVITEMVSEQIWVPGTVMSRSDSNIASEVGGRIEWMADVGELVQKGQVLARLDDELLQLQLEQNIADIAKWESRVALLERKQERVGKMAQLNNSSRDELDEIISELEVARQEIQQSRINKRQTEYRLAQTNVKAPFDAMVVERIQTPGEYTSVGADMLRVVDTQNIEASIRAPLSASPFITRGQEVLVKNRISEKSETIRTIVPVGNSGSRMMEIRVALKPGDFPIGSAVRVALPHSDAHEAITVKRDALVLRQAGTFVFIIDDENKAHQVPVRTGVGMGERVEVFGDIRNDDNVVVRGAERLRAGQTVRYQETTEIARN
ncbi:efflux RND transporter periplasmic adaptor subunit [Planctobacterium marinum]|uniref:efflux RND transporter periplasmic adaptor subunit n=1 Tax=Planctobacterium marinum TaxID=1631968 RepID=UPI001E3FACB3|nr:efflux RND transporter periplasmic adaptor subunit [Planctobacterium marinum]MCC2604235.1 efflux RND transporter periplasmic adaptor subunit [Planctobacterium marinum]